MNSFRRVLLLCLTLVFIAAGVAAYRRDAALPSVAVLPPPAPQSAVTLRATSSTAISVRKEATSVVAPAVSRTKTTTPKPPEVHIAAKTAVPPVPTQSVLLPKQAAPQVLAVHVSAKATTTESIPNSEGDLNQKDIVAFTNRERANEHLSALHFNATLAQVAEAKAKDMIAKQYFAHVSPDGTTIEDLAARYDYRYLNIGENLALGNFATSGEVVSGWMNSPGHRANIMNTHFTEIGVAAIKGTWEGSEVWYAVQEFGRPRSDCTEPDTVLDAQIERYRREVEALEATISHIKAELAAATSNEERNKHIDEYNTTIVEYNALVVTTKADIETYNAEVTAFNNCLAT